MPKLRLADGQQQMAPAFDLGAHFARHEHTRHQRQVGRQEMVAQPSDGDSLRQPGRRHR